MRSSVAYILLLVLAICYQSCDTTLNIEEPQDFIKYIGGNGDQTGVDLVTDANGNIYLLGNTSTASEGQQLYVVMTSPNGIMVWEQVLGDAGNETAKDIEISDNGSLVILADHTDLSGEKDFVVYNLNASNGSVINRAMSGLPGRAEYGNGITPVSGGYIVASYAERADYKVGLVINYNQQLQVDTADWVTTLEQRESEDPLNPGAIRKGYDVVPIKTFKASNPSVPNSEYFYTFCYSNTILSDTDATPDYNYFIYVTTRSGFLPTLTVQKPSDDPNSNERLTSVQQIPNGLGYVLSGYTSGGVTGRQNIRIVKVQPDLYAAVPSQKDVWIREQRTVGSGSSQISDVRSSIFATANSDFLILASENLDGNGDIYLTRVNRFLEDSWSSPGTSAVFGGINNDIPGAVTETANGRILICGTMGLGDLGGQTKMVLMNLSPNGLFGE